MASFENTSGRNGSVSGTSGSTTSTQSQSGLGKDSSTGRSEMGSQASATVREAGDQLKGAAGAATEKLKRTASDVGSELADSAVRMADAQKASGTRVLHSVSKAVDAAAGELETDAPFIARPIRDAARGIERFASDFDNRSVGELARRIGDYARREPATVIAGSVLVGFLLTRFLKSSAPRHTAYDDDYGDDEGFQRSGGFSGDRDFGGSYGRDRSSPGAGRMGEEGEFGSYASTARPGTAPERSSFSTGTAESGTGTAGSSVGDVGTSGAGSTTFGAQGVGGTRSLADEATGSSQTSPSTRTSTVKGAGDV